MAGAGPPALPAPLTHQAMQAPQPSAQPAQLPVSPQQSVPAQPIQ